ncbi:hypothetical protein [Mycolicibacterium porcinum]|nr:hypothetical protein [Mycolicibacterium porcinum]
MEQQKQHPAHPVRELALQLASGHLLPDDTADSIVERAEKYATFLGKSD